MSPTDATAQKSTPVKLTTVNNKSRSVSLNDHMLSSNPTGLKTINNKELLALTNDHQYFSNFFYINNTNYYALKKTTFFVKCSNANQTMSG